MKTDVLIVTFARDIPYLGYCLRSIKKFASDFSEVIVVAPEQEKSLFEVWADRQKSEHPAMVLRYYDRTTDNRKWHLAAQLEKMKADIHCPNADYVLHTDSDCVFTEPVTPQDYFVDGKPVMLIQSYASLGGAVPWQACTERAIGGPAAFETMRRHPQVNPVGIYKDVRDRVANVHKMAFHDYVLSCKADFPWGISEHNVIGAYALSEPRWKDQYHWMDVGTQPYPASKILQFWSHGPLDKPQGLPSGGNACPIDEFRRLGLI